MHLRPADLADVDGCAAVHVRGWQQTYAALAPGVAAVTPRDRLSQWREVLAADAGHYLVLEDEGRVVGVVGVAPERCELALLYLDAALHGSGWGGRLHDAGLDRLRATGCAKARLWVLEGNVRARGFYGRRGWVEDGRRQVVDIAGSPLVEVGYEQSL